ncbi:5-oxoprolinase subunit PxpB [Aquimarina sp. RZ0]|uniref:5-oxoprolinase subunit PxpB n=1 Tax=Aquimarina sp. RZ0 TaxID=2607730 RepID=UPI0011F2EA10|nr:5-oxoprolinase subunit PxpB [Aquimarina sp. RZ0]KAA1242645.1 5-oxoprolinase subunit PxpB [Aquimarina sp. RZ0]
MKKNKFEFQYEQYTENAILIKGSSEIDEILLDSLLFYKNEIENYYNKVIVEVISSYNWLLVCYVDVIEDFYSEVLMLKSLYSDDFLKKSSKKRLWKIPVCYSSQLAPELESFAGKKSMTIKELITLHTAPLYTVFFIGFLPGFLYLGGLDKKLVTSRKASPSAKLEKGSVAIGGNQTGIYPCDSPGGWHVIGKTPLDFFNPNISNPCFVTPGDKIQFISIKENEYNDISFLISSGIFTVESIFL